MQESQSEQVEFEVYFNGSQSASVQKHVEGDLVWLLKQNKNRLQHVAAGNASTFKVDIRPLQAHQVKAFLQLCRFIKAGIRDVQTQ